MRQDLISRCELFNRLATVQTLGEAYAVIQDMPTEEQRTGKWIIDDYDDEYAVCDRCGEPCATYVLGKPRDRFCKWCGVKMEGEKDG